MQGENEAEYFFTFFLSLWFWLWDSLSHLSHLSYLSLLLSGIFCFAIQV